MADRIIRDELWHSGRWLELPTDTHRLVYVSLIPRADDYGNLEGGPQRLYRWMAGFTQIKSQDDAMKVMSDLQDVDLVRRYEVKLSTGSVKEYWHLPRFKNQRRYWARTCPKSPHPEEEIPLKQRHRTKSSAESAEYSSEPAEYSERGRGRGRGRGSTYKGLSISPTRGQEVKVKTIYKKTSEEHNQEQLERNRRIALALASGNEKLARKIREGRA